MHGTAERRIEGQPAQGVGQLDLAAAARRGRAQDLEDLGGEDVPADHGEVAGRGTGLGLLHEVGDGQDVARPVVQGGHGRASVQVRPVVLDLHERHDAAATLLLDLQHPREQRIAFVDEVVTEQHRERGVTDVRFGAEDGVSQAERVALPHVVDVGQFARLADLAQLAEVALQLQQVLQFVGTVEVVLQGPLVPAGDHEHVVESAANGLRHHVLDGGPVHDREHLLGSRLGRGEESGAETRGRDDGLAGSAVVRRHEGVHSGRKGRQALSGLTVKDSSLPGVKKTLPRAGPCVGWCQRCVG